MSVTLQITSPSANTVTGRTITVTAQVTVANSGTPGDPTDALTGVTASAAGGAAVQMSNQGGGVWSAQVTLASSVPTGTQIPVTVTANYQETTYFIPYPEQYPDLWMIQSIDALTLPRTVQVVTAATPAFTVVTPANGATVDLLEGGGQVTVQLNITRAQRLPLTISISRDGQTTSQQFPGGTQYQTSFTIAPMPLGPRPLTITCADPDGIATTQTVTLNGRDAAPPQLQVEPLSIMGDANGAVTVPLHGTAPDTQSGMVGGSAKVEWALTAGGTRTTATPAAGGNFGSWTANVPLSGFGAHTVFVWATDNAGNTATKNIQVAVISSYVPATLEERLGEREYLAALLSFAQEQVNVPGPPPTPLDTSTLVAALGQPVDRLSQPLSATADLGSREVNQLRVPIELLRARIAATNTPTTVAGGNLALTYRTTAYASLLAAAGTSYEELRLARGADAATRQALAARLGIRLSATSPDELDQLLIDSPSLTEATLETLFGLPSTTATDPLRAPAVPLLLTWRLAAQALAWADQDQHPSPPRAFGVLADPDVINAADVVPGPNGDAIRKLLTDRAQLLTAFATTLTAATTGKSPAAGLAAMIALALPAGVDLAALAARDTQGVDIGADLAATGLTRAGFLYLRKLTALAAQGTLTGSEWGNATAVLTGAYKRRVQYPSWRAGESAFVLSPDFFVPGGTGPTANPYRADGQARADWQQILTTRVAQRQDLLDAIARAVAATEQTALPLLRDALITDLAATTTGDVGEAMSARFFVDVLAGGTLRTTRTRQAIESVQSLLSAKRSHELAPDHPAAGWILKNGDDTFNAAWAWMGEQGQWQAATVAFLFPERHLDPTLLLPGAASPTPFDLLFAAVSAPGATVTARTAADQAALYLQRKQVTFPAPYTTYLDPQRRDDHQKALANQSKAKETSGGTGKADNREIYWAVPMLLAQRLQAAGDYAAALDWYWILYPYDRASPVSVYNPVNTESLSQPDLSFPPGWTAGLNPFTLVDTASAKRPHPFTRGTLLSIIRCHLDYADAEFTRETDESVAHARTLYVTARRLLDTPALVPQKPTNPGEPALAIPELDTLRARAEMQLAKLRQGRNIAGMPRTQQFGAATVVQPTPYRFKTLLERARQLAAQATQMEAGYLAALEKYDDRTLRLYDAVKAVDLTAAQATVAASRVGEAHDAVTSAVAQKTKAETMVTSYAAAIAAPPNEYETQLLGEYSDLRDLKDGIAAADTAIGIMQEAAKAGSWWSAVTSFGVEQGLAPELIGAMALKGGFQIAANHLEAQMQANQLQAGIEQRKDEWRLQQVAAQQDALVAAAQVATARDQVTIAVQEEAVADLAHDQAAATLKFLSGQFTNPDLYLWMSNTLGGVYRYFLQQATATARLAQAQLAFERAEPAQVLIRQDYTQSPPEMTANATPNRQALTGAEQLTEDLARLDEYAFSSARRRLNLSQTFSLARLMPVEFLRFRRTGTLAFATPMSLFDADFPGHYLRLVRQVRTSLVALVPPDRGIRATLYSNGISRVTTGRDGAFQDIVVRSDPGVVSLTSPVNAGGVFELDAQSEMLLPFESSGVDTTWEFQLPPAANPFDFSTIADVLITIDYTAAYDDTYRSQVVSRLNADRSRGADCVFSLARDFPDQWYDLNNPADPAARSVTVPLRDVDFPVGVEALSTASVTVHLSSGDPVPDTVVTLTRGGAGGAATATGGIAGTRRGNATAWLPLCGSAPAGDWRLGFGPDAAALFASGALDDITLVIGWIGQAPVWEP
ncbi:Tc toxin subunit A-related protein [Streptomyces sp. 7R007]